MMSKKQFACMLTLHITYLFVGAAIFYHIESPLELQQRAEDKLERLEIQNLLYENYLPNDPEKQDNILRKLSQYCGKSMFNYTTEDEEGPVKWDFYHSFFFSYTVVSTIGYGNLAPTVHLSRILMIFYGLFGIPINGILLANLGEYFGLQLIKVYRKYKKRNEKRADKMDFFFNNLGMLGQIILYLVPGFLFFIFLPACIFVIFEGWDYVGAVYYAFVTLTTIGFGDMVAGTINNGFAYGYFFSYQIFLIVWITFGLGYIVMLLGFITTGMRSEGIHKLEQKLACQFKSTQSKILQGFTRDLTNLRKVINEANLLKVKPIYVDASPHLHRSVSCPNFTFDVEPRGPIYKRKRANSENINLSCKDMLRIQSDTDLLGIDKEKTFTASAIVKPAELLARVVNVLGGIETRQNDKGVHMFSDNQILASEKPPVFTIGQHMISDGPKRDRALSIAVPNYKKESITKIDPDLTWHNGDTGDKLRNEVNKRAAKYSLPSKITPTTVHSSGPWSLFTRIFRKRSSIDSPTNYLNNTIKGRLSLTEGNKENISEKPSGGPKPRRGSFFPSFYLGESDDSGAESYKEKTKSGRQSLFPSFDFSEDEDAAAVNSYQKKTKRHSIFPTFDFSDVETDDSSKVYKEKPRTRRRSIFPTFDFSDPEDDATECYKENTRRGRHSIFPTFDFSEHKKDDDTIDNEEIEKYQNRTKKGRFSLFPTFGRYKQNDEEDVMPENSEELNNYQTRTRNGRNSLFPTFGKYRKTSSPTDSASNLEASFNQYHKQTGNSGYSHASDIQHYKNSTEGGRKSSASSDLDNYRDRTRRGRPSLFETDVNITSLPESEQVEILEHTSVADVLRALALLESASPNANHSSIPTGFFDLISEPMAMATKRRGSQVHEFNLPSSVSKNVDEVQEPRRRRISGRGTAPQFTPTLATVVAGAELQTTARAARETRMTMVTHPSSNNDGESQTRVRRYSPAPGGPVRTATGPVPRLFSRIRKDSNVSAEEDSPSRRGSLTNIVIDTNKPKT